jgi:protease II
LLQFYTVKDPLDRPYKVLRHSINAAAGSTDDVVFEEPDEVCVRGGGGLWVCVCGFEGGG